MGHCRRSLLENRENRDAALNAAKNALVLAKKVGTISEGGIQYYLNQLDKFSITTK